jgi:hypothetical protein
MGRIDLPMAQVARLDLSFCTMSVPALSAAASATLGVPTSASTAAEGLVSR